RQSTKWIWLESMSCNYLELAARDLPFPRLAPAGEALVRNQMRFSRDSWQAARVITFCAQFSSRTPEDQLRVLQNNPAVLAIFSGGQQRSTAKSLPNRCQDHAPRSCTFSKAAALMHSVPALQDILQSDRTS